MRTVHADLIAAQYPNYTPYIYLYINGVDYSSRLLALEHIEEPYRESAIVMLDNHDRALDPSTVNLRGKSFTIGYGYNTATGNRWLGDGKVANQNPAMPTLWVKSQYVTSVEGKVVCNLSCEGMWAKLREIEILPVVTDVAAKGMSVSFIYPYIGYVDCVSTDIGKVVVDDGVALDPGILTAYDNTLRKWWFTSKTSIASGSSLAIASGTGAGGWSYASVTDVGSAPDYRYEFGGTQTVRELISLVLTQASFYLNPSYVSDGIIDVSKPYFQFNPQALPSLASIIENDSGTGILQMTKCFMRPEANLTYRIVYPTDVELADITYYSYKDPQFKEYTEKRRLVIPNDIKVFWGADPDDTWTTDTARANLDIPGTAIDAASIASYTVVRRVYHFPHISTQAEATLIAEAILAKFNAETFAGRLILPFHDCRVELFDKIGIQDVRRS